MTATSPAMPRTTFLRILLPASLALACDAPDLVPDRGEDDPALVEFRDPAGSFGGSTRLNTAKLFVEGLPIRHFDRDGDTVTYDDPGATQVTFTKLRLAAGGGEYDPNFYTITVEQGRVRLNGVLLDPGELLGSEWHYTLDSASTPPRNTVLRVTGVGIAVIPAGTLPLYNFNLTPATKYYDNGNYSACDRLDDLTHNTIVTTPPDRTPPGVPNNFRAEYAAVLYGNVKVSELGVVANDPAVATVACVSGAVGKAGLWGYPPWVSSYLGRNGVQQLQAATRAIRADFCADGTSNTADGTPIQVRDRYYDMFEDATEQIESVWGTNGSLCRVTSDRLDSGSTHTCGGTLTASCRQYGSDWITGPDQFMWIKVDPDMTTTANKPSCTIASFQRGCEDPGIEAVVCAAAPSCCNVRWGAACVSKVTALLADQEACCSATGNPGCGSAGVSACVATYDPSCSGAWDSYCALEVEALNCGTCR
jgi:hypothetical protein